MCIVSERVVIMCIVSERVVNMCIVSESVVKQNIMNLLVLLSKSVFICLHLKWTPSEMHLCNLLDVREMNDIIYNKQ